jgi:hypothetical protein
LQKVSWSSIWLWNILGGVIEMILHFSWIRRKHTTECILLIYELPYWN